MHGYLFEDFKVRHYDFYKSVKLLYKKLPLYWIKDIPEEDVVYTLGALHLANARFFKKKFIFTEEYYPRHPLKDFIAKSYYRLFKGHLFFASTPITYEFLKNAGIDVMFVPPVFPRPKKPRGEFILYVGRPEPVKRSEYVIEIARQFPEEKIVMVGMSLTRTSYSFETRGNKEYLNEIKNNAPKNVELIESIPKEKVFEYYKKAKMLLVPSLSEGFGLPVIEALGHSVPVLATREVPSSSYLPEEWRVPRKESPLEWTKRVRKILENWDNEVEKALEYAKKYHLFKDDVFHKENKERLGEYV